MGMKINISNIKYRIRSTVDRDSSKMRLNPERDWLIILGLFFVLTAGVSIYSYGIFTEVYNNDGYQSEDTFDTQQIRYDRFQKEITKTLEYYKQKEVSFNILLREGPTVFIISTENIIKKESARKEDFNKPVLTQ